MNAIKKIVGVLCILLGFAAEYYLVTQNGVLVKNPDENRIFVWTVIPVSLVVVLGFLTLFGFYAIKGEYDE